MIADGSSYYSHATVKKRGAAKRNSDSEFQRKPRKTKEDLRENNENLGFGVICYTVFFKYRNYDSFPLVKIDL